MIGRDRRPARAAAAALLTMLCAAAFAADPAASNPAPADSTPGETRTFSMPAAPRGSPAFAPRQNPAAPGAAAEDIRDIRGPKYVLPAWLIPAIAAAVVLLAFAAFGTWRWVKRRRRARILAPFELALARLEAIRPLMQPPRAREFSTAVSGVVRTYIEQRFDVIATHRTTEEFLKDLMIEANAALARHRALLAEFLEQCDLVKFAGISLTRESMESLHHSARAFVLETAAPDAVAVTPGPVPSRARGEAHDSLPST